jgi:hypothetical protein
VEIRISVADGDLTVLESLGDWLRSERELVGRVKLTGQLPRDGELGALDEAVVVAVGSGGAITVLVSALARTLKAWLSLPRRSDVTIKIHRYDGTSVEISAKRVTAGAIDIEAAIRGALDFGPSMALGSSTAEE